MKTSAAYYQYYFRRYVSSNVGNKYDRCHHRVFKYLFWHDRRAALFRTLARNFFLNFNLTAVCLVMLATVCGLGTGLHRANVLHKPTRTLLQIRHRCWDIPFFHGLALENGISHAATITTLHCKKNDLISLSECPQISRFPHSQDQLGSVYNSRLFNIGF